MMFIQPQQQRRIQTRREYRCTECEINIPSDRNTNIARNCEICGSLLHEVVSEVQLPSENQNRPSDFLADLFGEDLLSLIEESFSDARPSRQISKSYLSSIGRTIVDDRKGILMDITLEIGPLVIMAIPASFGPLPDAGRAPPRRVVVAHPEWGESPLVNEESAEGSIVVLKRGIVTFARKAVTAISAGASLVVIVQSSDIWPFIMTDGPGEFQSPDTLLLTGEERRKTVPIVMISKRDGTLLSHLLSTPSSRSSSSETKTESETGSWEAVLACHNRSGQMECCICQEVMSPGTEVLKLHCRHVYHTTCVESWLEKNNTCPMCRSEMPTEVVEGGAESARRRASRPEDAHRMPYFT